MNLTTRLATKNDLLFLIDLEDTSFLEFQKSSKKTIVHSIKSAFQEVFILENETLKPIGSLTLYKYKKSLRIYSISIAAAERNQGIGNYLLDVAFEYAKKNKFRKIILEVSEKNIILQNWYKSKGFITKKTIKNYYCKNENAIKMEYTINPDSLIQKTNNIIVINQPFKWNFTGINAKVISVKEYINEAIYQTNTDLRIFNLCSSYKYQSFGYYVSLLASARGQRIIPNSLTIRDFKIANVIESATYEIDEIINKSLEKVRLKNFTLEVYFGQSIDAKYNNLSSKLYQLFEAPLFTVNFVKNEKWLIKNIEVNTLSKVPEENVKFISDFAKKYFNKKHFRKTKLINYKYDIAVLVNPNEKTPPSCSKALEKFKIAANKKGLYLEFITKKDFDKLNEFDALFIRETTNVNDYTYEFSRLAYSEGLVVIDDPWSILKCSNKIYQNEIFKKYKILTPETAIFTKNIFSEKSLDSMQFPLVLKQPDSAFSIGMTKVENKEEAIVALNKLFKKSDMIVCQEFLYSDFDWRIGVLDNKPIFACKYYMAKDHWQIYNWKENSEESAGDSETLPVGSVPEIVLKTALKAAALIGDGLYGVDLKMINNKVYVVEVNDNPNIDAGIEDRILKDTLYDLIIESIYNRIELAKNIQKINAVENNE
jgi:glutathione synthase/RimK-type ligase-like ATP-grasp enzyme/ribosomal protein S18 acetylase RimI-like enzyme